MRCQPGKDCVREEVQVAQQEGLAENHRCDRDVHGVSDVAVGAFDDQVFCGKDGCRGADALEGEASEGFEHYGHAGGYQQDSDGAEGREA
jgi:hypothetical protein